MFPPQLLETPRLSFRPPTLEDARRVFETYACDPEVTRYMLWRPHRSVADSRAFLSLAVTAWRLGEEHRPWILERKEDGRFVGMIGVSVDGHAVEVGYVIGRAFWGQGYAPEALMGVCDAAFADRAIHRLSAVCDAENTASMRVLEKAGLAYEGLLRSYHVMPNLGETPRDCRLYARVRRDHEEELRPLRPR